MGYYDWRSNNESNFNNIIILWFMFKFKRISLLVSVFIVIIFLFLFNSLILKSFAFLGVLALITIWILNALYLGLTVFISDFCVNPEENTLEMANHNNIKPSNIFLFL